MADLSDVDFDMLSSYLSGHASPQARAAVEAWMARSEDRRAWVARAQTAWRASELDTVPPLDMNAFRAVLGERTGIERLRQSGVRPSHPASVGTRQQQRRQQRQQQRRPSMGWPRRAWYMAAGVAVSAAVVVAAWLGGMHRVSSVLSAHQSVYATGNGERTTITLPDGSTALLNVASQLRVPADYALGNRTVYLSGEAYFTAVRHASAPFTVVSGSSTTRVLGTRFVVRHYTSDTATVVAVGDGRVAVGPAVVAANQEVTVLRTGIMPVQPAKSFRFGVSKGVLSLVDAGLGEAVPDLNRWFDADVHLADARLKQRRLTGEYAPGSVANLAEILELTFGIRVVREGRTLTLYPRN